MGERGCVRTENALTFRPGLLDRPADDHRPLSARGPGAMGAATCAAPTVGVPTALPRWAGDRYEIGPLLGQGGAGEVYRGFDRTLHRDVAIKALHCGDESDQAERFAREARLLARLQHPHLIPLYDAALGDGRRYLVMPLIRGTTLAERITAGPVPKGETERIATALAGALAYVHAHGVVHRDVKPSNVLLGRGGQIFLADFGIALSDETDQTRTAPGRLTGTAAYLAPEQVEGGETGPACDVYALGLVLLEALTGVRAFPGTLLEQSLARLWRQPEIPVSLGPGWVRLLDAMTARDPAQRPDPAHITALIHHVTDLEPAVTTTMVLPLIPAAIRPFAGAAGRRRPVSRAVSAALFACVLAALTLQSASVALAPARQIHTLAVR